MQTVTLGPGGEGTPEADDGFLRLVCQVILCPKKDNTPFCDYSELVYDI